MPARCNSARSAGPSTSAPGAFKSQRHGPSAQQHHVLLRVNGDAANTSRRNASRLMPAILEVSSGTGMIAKAARVPVPPMLRSVLVEYLLQLHIL